MQFIPFRFRFPIYLHPCVELISGLRVDRISHAHLRHEGQSIADDISLARQLSLCEIANAKAKIDVARTVGK